MGNKFELGIEQKINNKSIIGKLGTDTLLRNGNVDRRFAARIAEQTWAVRDLGRPVALISSGEKALGGQTKLTAAWNRVLAPHGIVGREVIFREETFDQHLDEVGQALDDGVVPIINGDSLSRRTKNNDHLATEIALTLGADVAYLTTENGVLDRDRRVISNLTRETDVTYWSQSRNGTGGMPEKVAAALAVAEVGHEVIIANGRQKNVLYDFAVRKKDMQGTRIDA